MTAFSARLTTHSLSCFRNWYHKILVRQRGEKIIIGKIQTLLGWSVISRKIKYFSTFFSRPKFDFENFFFDGFIFEILFSFVLYFVLLNNGWCAFWENLNFYCCIIIDYIDKVEGDLSLSVSRDMLLDWIHWGILKELQKTKFNHTSEPWDESIFLHINLDLVKCADGSFWFMLSRLGSIFWQYFQLRQSVKYPLAPLCMHEILNWINQIWHFSV